MLFVENCISFGARMSAPALTLIQEAAGLPLTNAEKMDYVVAKLKENFPGATKAFLRTLAEAAYDKWLATK
jgi:hypothetical protein